FTLMEIVSDKSVVEEFDHLYNRCEIRYGDMKKKLAEDIVRFITPIRERIKEIDSNETLLRKVVAQGAEKARLSASPTIEEVRQIIGFRRF
ncbi:MAG: tryptophan--tRNA ligase, partial [Bacteroidales bacterium]|nr:tryptophan--tRNA ligase [Bacteroidales bacterium]